MTKSPWKISIMLLSALVLLTVPTALGKEGAATNLIKTDLKGQVLEQSFDPFTFTEVMENGRAYYRLDNEDFRVTRDPGKPELPCESVLVAIPEGVSLSLEVLETQTANFSDRPIYPAPRHEKKETGEGCVYLEERFYCDPVAYSQNAFYPESPAVIERVGKIRDLPVVRISYYPIQFNPATGVCKEHSMIKVKLSYGSPALVTHNDAGPMGGLCSRNVVGYNAPPATKSGSKGSIYYPLNIYDEHSADYLILTSNTYYANALADFNSGLPFKNSINKLAEVRSTLNDFDVAVVRVEDIIGGNEVESIKTFIQYVYDEWNAPHMTDNNLGYLLLVGNFNDITSYYIEDSHDYGYADRYYGCIGDADFSTPDIMMGRLTCDDSADLTVMTSKIIDYEDVMGPGMDSWREEMLHVQGTVSLFAHYEFVKGTLIENGGFEMHEVFDQGWQAPGLINGFINDGCWIVGYTGHGGFNNWENYHVGDFDGMNNGDKLPFVMSLACITGQYWTPDDCMGEIFMHSEDKGAVAFWGASKVSYSGSFSFATYVYKHMFIDYAYGLGELINESIVRIDGEYEEYNLLGDPALDLSLSNSRPGLPDAAMRYSNLSMQLLDADRTLVKTKVDNIGDAVVSALDVRFWAVDDQGLWSQIGNSIIPEILPGETGETQQIWNTTAPEQSTVIIEVDPGMSITESYESNNMGGTSLTPVIGGTEYPIWINDNFKNGLDMSGDLVVWSERINDEYDILGYDFATGQSLVICDDPGNQTYPAIEDDQVVWKHSGTDGQYLRVKNLTTGAIIDIDTDGQQVTPDISGNYVVWAEMAGLGHDTEIYSCDLTNMFISAIFPDDRSIQSQPSVYGDFVVWIDNRYGTFDILGHRINSPIMIPMPICTDPGTQSSPQIYGDNVIWLNYGDQYTSIDGYNMATYQSFSLGSPDVNQSVPMINKNWVTWNQYPIDGDITNKDVYGCELGENTIFAICTDFENQYSPVTNGKYYAWLDNRNYSESNKYDIYAFKAGPDVPGGLQGTCVNQEVHLSWNAVEPPLHGYRIYRNVHPSTTEFVMIKQADEQTTSWVDPSPVKGANNYYKVSGFISYPITVESDCCDAISVYVPKKKPNINPNMQNP